MLRVNMLFLNYLVILTFLGVRFLTCLRNIELKTVRRLLSRRV